MSTIEERLAVLEAQRSSLMPESRKLRGLIYVLITLLVLTIIAVACVVFIPEVQNLFIAIGSYVLGIGTAHQTAQAAADRSPNYVSTPSTPPSAQPPVGGIASFQEKTLDSQGKGFS